MILLPPQRFVTAKFPARTTDRARQIPKLVELQNVEQDVEEEVDDEDVAEVVARWTGVPVTRLMEGEAGKLA